MVPTDELRTPDEDAPEWLAELGRITGLLGELHHAFERLSAELAQRFGGEGRGPAWDADQLDDEILRRVQDAPRLTTPELAQHAGCTVAEVRAAVTRLVEAGRLERHGRGRGTFYTSPAVSEQFGESAAAEERRRRVVIDLARGKGAVSTQDVVDALGLSYHHTRLLLNGMVASGRLSRRGQRRGTTYVLPHGRSDRPRTGELPFEPEFDEVPPAPPIRPRATGRVERVATGSRTGMTPPPLARPVEPPPAERREPRPAPRAALPAMSIDRLLELQRDERGSDFDDDGEPDDGELPDLPPLLPGSDAEPGSSAPAGLSDALIEAVLQLLDDEPLTAVEVADRLAMPTERAVDALDRLAAEGMLERRMRGKVARYALAE